MFGPNLHGDAAAGGASKIDLLGQRPHCQPHSEPLVSPGPAQPNIARDEADIDQSLSQSPQS